MIKKPGEDNFTHEIRQKLEDYRPNYNPSSWNKINAQLQNNKPTFQLKPWLTASAAVTLVTLITVFLYKHINTSSDIIYQLNTLTTEINDLKTQNTLLANQVQSHSKNTHPSGRNKAIEAKRHNSHSLPKHDNILSSSTPTNKTLRPTKLKKLAPTILFNEAKINTTQPIKHQSTPITQNKNQETPLKKKGEKIKLNLNKLLSEKYTGPTQLYASSNSNNELNIDGYNKFSQSFGVGIAGKLTPKVHISGGANIGLFNWSLTNKYSHYDYTYSADSTSMNTYTINDSTITDKSEWQYIDIPIQFHYAFFNTNKSTIDAYIGTSARFFLKEKYESSKEVDNEIVESTIIKYSAIKNYHLLAKLNIGFSYSYKINNKWMLKMQPHYTMSLQKLSAMHIKNKSIGINFNVCYYIKNRKSL